MRMRSRSVMCGVVLLAAACSGAPEPDPSDAGPTDAGPSVPRWEPIAMQGEPDGPGPRWGALTAAAGGRGFLVMGTDLAGGNTDVAHLYGDVWELDVDSGTFSAVATGSGPSPRYCGCAAFDPTREELLVVGGRTWSDTEDFPEAWLLDVGHGEWTKIAGLIPQGSVGCQMAYSHAANAYVLFGGLDLDAVFVDETWLFDPTTFAFRLLDAHGPLARYDGEMKELSGGDLLLVGGAGYDTAPHYLADVWRFAVADNTWSELVASNEAPVGRRYPWTALSGDDSTLLVAFGASGFASSDVQGDVWSFDLVARTWAPLAIDGTAPRARAFTHWLPGPAGSAGTVWSGFDMITTHDDAMQLMMSERGGAWH